MLAQNLDDDSIPRVKIEKRGARSYVVGTVSINAQPENVWNVLVDYPKAPEVFENLKLCEVVESKGRVKLVRQVVRTGLPFEFDYIVALTEDKPYRIEWYRESGSLKEVTGSWELEPDDSGEKTKITYSIFIDGGFCLPPWLLNSQIKNYLPVLLNSLRHKVESTRAS
jgi:uncharacterized membrane protein